MPAILFHLLLQDPNADVTRRFGNSFPATMQSLTGNFDEEHVRTSCGGELAVVTPQPTSLEAPSPTQRQQVFPQNRPTLTMEMQPGSSIFSPTKIVSRSSKKRKCDASSSAGEESRSFAVACCRRLNKSEGDWKRKQQWTFICK